MNLQQVIFIILINVKLEYVLYVTQNIYLKFLHFTKNCSNLKIFYFPMCGYLAFLRDHAIREYCQGQSCSSFQFRHQVATRRLPDRLHTSDEATYIFSHFHNLGPYRKEHEPYCIYNLCACVLILVQVQRKEEYTQFFFLRQSLLVNLKFVIRTILAVQQAPMIGLSPTTKH